MSFDSIAFGVFFLVSFTIYWAVPKDSFRRVLLTSASFLFYGFWDYRYVALMVFVIVVAFLTALAIARCTEESYRRRWLAVGVALHLSVLFFFKYVDFFLGSLNGLAEDLGLAAKLPLPNVVLPVGISFFTFHAISYTIDVFRQKVNAERAFFRVALYISFFPQLIAGPIVRASFFLPQLQEMRQLDPDFIAKGLRQFLLGFFFKTVLADNLAALADPVFNDPGKWDTAGLWVGAVAYYAQIYFDFAGYSLMAIGCSLWFGYRLPDNFTWPYSSVSVTEFWRRWHMSLSSWLRDYLYIPLGGNRQGLLHQYKNLLLTMVLGGLWHGASWNFVIWGALHGIALVAHKSWTIWRTESSSGEKPWIALLPAWFLTQTWVFVAWIFFRSREFTHAVDMLSGLSGFKNGGAESLPIFFIPVILLVLFLDALLGRFFPNARIRVPAGTYAVVVGAVCAFFLWLKPLSTVPFIYFQF